MCLLAEEPNTMGAPSGGVGFAMYLLMSLLVYYICMCIYHFLKRQTPGDQVSQLATKKLVVVLGSGGHTTEMVAMIKNIDIKLFS
mgnify:CR=1 FL=1